MDAGQKKYVCSHTLPMRGSHALSIPLSGLGGDIMIDRWMDAERMEA